MPTPDLTVLGHNSGTLWQLNDLRTPTGAEAARRYHRMSSEDPLIGAVLYAAQSIMSGVEWTVEPNAEATNRTAAEAEARFLREAWADMSHTPSDFISDAASMLVHGWAYFEVVYKYRQGEGDDATRRSQYTDGRVGWRKFALRPQRTLSRWEHDGDGGVQGMWQRARPRDVLLPIDRALHLRMGGPGEGPEGRSMLRNAYRSWYFVHMLEEFEAVGIERDSTGIPHMQVPVEYLSADATPAQRAAVAEIESSLRELRANRLQFLITPAEQHAHTTTDDEGNSKTVVLPTGFKFAQIQNGGAKASAGAEVAIRRHSQRLAQSTLSEFLLLGMEKGGSFAMHEDKTDLMVKALTAVLDSIEEALNRHPVARLYALNGVPVEHRARLKHAPVTVKDVTALADAVSTLTASGVLMPDDDLEDHMRRTLELPAANPTTARRPAQPTQAPTTPTGGTE